MGIDIYAKWDRMSRQEEAAQITGFSVEHGHVGYLREAYHGEPYATKVFVPQAFEDGGDGGQGGETGEGGSCQGTVISNQ